MEADLVKCLNDAADLIEKGGLAKGVFRSGGFGSDPNSYCTIGAIRAACPDNMGTLGDDGGNDKPVAKLLGFKTIEKVFTWNDRKTRTKEEVVARLHAAAEKVRLGAV